MALCAVQLALLIPWMRSGEWLTGWTPTALADVTRFTDGDIAGSLGTFALQALALWSFDGDRACAGSVWQGFVAALLPWFLLAPFIFALTRALAEPVFATLVRQYRAKPEGKKSS